MSPLQSNSCHTNRDRFMENDFSNVDSDFHDLIVKVLSDIGSSEEIKILKEWIAKSPDNRTYFQQMSQMWQISSIIQEPNRFNADAGWEKAKQMIKAEETAKTSRLFNFSFIVRAAAIWALIFLLGGMTFYLGFRNTLKVSAILQASINEVVAPMGSKSQVFLPDGTMVWLNAGSKLRYSQTYNTNHRDVYLEGEAYFKVKTNPAKPFIVKTSEMSVKAYGTAFNVKAYPDEGTITTTLVEGIVKIEGADKDLKKFEISLKPQQKLVYTKKSFSANMNSHEMNKKGSTAKSSGISSLIEDSPMVVDVGSKTSLYTSWKDEKWIVERERLDDLVVKLERRFNVTVVYKSEALKEYKISGIIRKETLEQVLDLLKLTTPLKYQIKNGIVTLDVDKSRSENYSKVMN